jgi:hypothetical protein
VDPDVGEDASGVSFDQNIGAADAHRQAVLPTTWEKSDAENFFDTIPRLF